MSLSEEIKQFFKGEVLTDEATLETYSRDASLFKVRPQIVVYPKDTEDLENLIKWISMNKRGHPVSTEDSEEKNPAKGGWTPGVHRDLSLTIRAAGTDMSGGPINDSIIADVSKYLNKIGEIREEGTKVEPGAFYRDFENKTLENGLILPCYTASKNLCALGGMIANNCAGEKSLRYGKMENYLKESKWILADGKEYSIKPLNPQELKEKMAQEDFEGNIYRETYKLLQENREIIAKAKPQVSKNSAGYYLWNVFDGQTFDLNKLLVGSQGTLGVMTEATVSLVPVEKASQLFVIFLPDLSRLAELVNVILPTGPDSIESYDDQTLKLAVRFFPEMFRSMKPRYFLSLIFSFIPELFMMLRGGVPKLILLIEYSGKSAEEAGAKIEKLQNLLKDYHLVSRKTISEEEASKYWTVRRESFNLLRKHLHGLRTAPFVDDVVVPPQHMPEFLPKMQAILDSYNLTYTIAGHAGQGNFHIIPLIDAHDHKNVEIIKESSEKIYDLVASFGGSITGEHNDGIVRTPYLHKMYSPEILALFTKVKNIFDPQNIFNPQKKVPSTGSGQAGAMQYWESHLDIG